MKNSHGRLLLVVLFALATTMAIAQVKTITGIVTDPSGEPIIGANVTVDGTSNGTITDVDGNFRLQNVDNNSKLKISYIGYVTQTLSVLEKNSFKITLAEDAQMLNEVVVVGYGTMRKKDLTGSVVQIRPNNVALEAPKSIQDVLRGTPGLRVAVNTSAKGGGDLEIRGDRSVSDISTHNPLLILDGMPFYGELSEINVNDIGQIDVLKDASAAAVYGAKAANGVVIITTKKGQIGKPVINFRTNFSLDTRGAYTDFYSAEGYMKYREDWYKVSTYDINPATGRYEAYQKRDSKGNLLAPMGYYDHPGSLPDGVSLDAWRAYGPVSPTEGESDASLYARRLLLKDVTLNNYILGKSFDWVDHAYRTGINQDYNLSISGATERINYYLGVGYSNNQSAIKGDDYTALRANMKLSAKVTDWLEVGANVNFQDRSDDSQPIDISKNNRNSPYANYTDENGNLVAYPMGVTEPNSKGYNWAFEQQYRDRERGYTILNSILNAKITLPFNITYSFNASPRYQYYYRRDFQSADHPDWLAVNVGVDREQRKNFEWSLNNTINWDYTFAGKHHVNLTLVQEAEELRSWDDLIKARNIQPSDVLGIHNTSNAGKNESSFSSTDTHQTAAGYMGRLFYSFDERYMFTATYRRDGYSAFGANRPYANFPSFGASWMFTNEKFFTWKTMSTGKLRLSWGQNGNRSLKDPYIALANLKNGSSLYSYLTTGGTLTEQQYLIVDRLANPNLSWETSEAFNVGLDFGFLNDRITGTIEGYSITTKNMIMPKSLPNFIGFANIGVNLGEVQNKGFELTINSQNIQHDNFKWSTSFNLSYNVNKVKHLYYEYEDVLDNNGNVIGQKERDEYGKWFIGKDISTIWGYKVTGIWQADEIEEAARHGQVPGDPKVANTYTADDIVNADGSITPVYNDKDKVFLGKTVTPLFWQMRNSFTFYKNFEFSFNIYSYWGSKFSDTNYLNRDNEGSGLTYGQNMAKKTYWTPEKPVNTYARLNAIGPAGAENPAIIRDGSFIRLENVSLGYNLPKSLLSKWQISNAQVYGSIRNLAVWEKEKYSYGDIETKGYLNRVFTLGINLTF